MFLDSLNVAIFVPQFPNHYSVLGRHPNDEQKLCLLNIWKHGTFMFDTKIFPLNRLRNMNGKNLIATTFERKPTVYRDETNQLTGYEANSFFYIIGCIHLLIKSIVTILGKYFENTYKY